MTSRSKTTAKKKTKRSSRSAKELNLALTPEQQKQLVAYMHKSGDTNPEVSLTFSADVAAGVIAPATFLVGNAV